MLTFIRSLIHQTTGRTIIRQFYTLLVIEIFFLQFLVEDKCRFKRKSMYIHSHSISFFVSACVWLKGVVKKVKLVAGGGSFGVGRNGFFGGSGSGFEGNDGVGGGAVVDAVVIDVINQTNYIFIVPVLLWLSR